MKYFLDLVRRTYAPALVIFLVLAAATVAAFGELPAWIRNVEGNSALEGVFFRMMPLPNGAAPFRRPPQETRAALSDLIKSQPNKADLYSLRALEDEQVLDFASAESDWKAYVENSSDRTGADLALADFYRRRLRPADEIKILSQIASAPTQPAEKLTSSSQQRSWQAFERIFRIIQEQGSPKETSISQYRAWINRYPNDPSLYGRFLQFLVEEKEYGTAGKLIDDYRKQFPNDQVFLVKAKAAVEYRRGSIAAGLSLYEQSFQPLWDPQLVKAYFDLLRDTHSLRKFRDQTYATLAANPLDLNATARLFYYFQQQGKTDAAEQALANLRLHKESSRSPWTSQELYICARLLEDIHDYPESARYYFALYNSKDLPDAQETAIAGLAGVLLTAPETPIRFGSGELSMYRDIATMDQGPGYLNGLLSLILNSTQPAAQYSQEEQQAVPYFHRSRAAELLVLLDAKYPQAKKRPQLHAQLLEFYANSGEGDAVIEGGRNFLAAFPNASERTAVALRMADAYARKDQSAEEFAIYDSVLKELAAKAENVPLGASTGEYPGGYLDSPGQAFSTIPSSNAEGDDSVESPSDENPDASVNRRRSLGQSFQIASAAPTAQAGARSPEYSSVLERYLARLVERKQIPAALGVLRREIDRNPDDPGLYGRLAVFLEQNRLGAQEEEVYRLAISHFSDKSWYDRLAGLYLREKKEADLEKLTREAVATFQGTELERYFRNVGGSPGLYLRLNLYANQRFPHNPVFIGNLLNAYRTPQTRDLAAWEALLRQHWFEDANLRNEFFEFLSRTGRLEGELAALRQSAPDLASWQKNPAAADFIASAHLWRSHFEESAPLLESLAGQYPADAEIAHSASSVVRSLAYFDSANTAVAAKIEDNFLQSNLTDTQTMARVGDIFADREQFADAVPYWERIPQVTPGQPAGYLDAATIYWDYFDFNNAMRLLAQGRDRLHNPNLYSFEAGAIYENQRDYPRAISEYVKGALDAPGGSAESRLLQLARRPKFRDIVDQTTSQVAVPPDPSMPALSLRVKILEAQNRKPEIESLLDAVANGTSSIELAEEIESLAQQKSLESVRQHAIEKQAAITIDPVARLQLRYALIRLYEGRKDFAAARKEVEALYRENPKVLGVVRSTVDFYWRTNLKPQAVSVLLQAAKDSYPALRAQFTFEAARKATEAKQYDQARELLNGLLKDSPYDGEYLAAMADTYAQAGDDAGLQQFYLEKIASLRSAPLPADSRKAQVATLRRGLIPAITRMSQYAAAVDQYVELINNFPEDDALVTEAALYALRYHRQPQLVGFYTRTVAQSPRDYRWSMVLARIQTNLEDYPAAIDTYAKSIAIRPDRADLYIARAGLEERLMRFDDAVADYQHIYQLAYKDPQWMEKIAVICARQGKTDQAVAALQTALVTGRPESASKYFEVARRLEGWGMLEPARDFAKTGIRQAGTDLLANSEHHAGANTYVRIMTRLRLHDEGYATLQSALAASAAELPVLKEQFGKQGITGLTDAQWREHTRQNRIETARNGFEAALREMGTAVDRYFTPEERLSFARFAEQKHNGMSDEDVEKFAIPLTMSASLADQEARWRFDILMHRMSTRLGYNDFRSFVDLQRRRGRFAELALQMEQLASVRAWDQGISPLYDAADAYHSAGDEQNELRVLSAIFSGANLGSARQERFFQLLLERQPDELVRIASRWSRVGTEQAANYAVAHGTYDLARMVVEGRSKARPPVWNKAYNALIGLYFSQPSAAVGHAFLGALGDASIGDRLGNQVDRTQQLAGHTWFYYSSRYGEYLSAGKLGNSDDFSPALLEESPATAAGYRSLGDYFSGSGKPQRAVEEYKHALELSPGQPDVHNALAAVYDRLGDRTNAVEQWKQALAVLLQQINSASVPESFWREFGRTCDQLRIRHAFASLNPEVDTVVSTYLRHNGTYRSNALLHPAYAALGDPALATHWLLDISSAAPDPAAVLSDIADASWIPLAQRAPIYQRILQLKEDAVAKSDGIARQNAQQVLDFWQERWIRYLIQTKQYQTAADSLAALPQETRDAQKSALIPLDLLTAAHLGTLDIKLAAYRSQPQALPPAEILRTASREIFEEGDKLSARKILELVFAREIEEHKLVASNFLGLAEIRLAAGDTTGALDLLHRLVIAVGNPFENLDPAAALLEKTGHNTEAAEFLDQLVRSAPWEASYRLRLAKARLATGNNITPDQEALIGIASSPAASYDLRLKAAAALVGRPYKDLGSGELNFIAAGKSAMDPQAADKFYFYQARIQAAALVPDPQQRVTLLSHCTIDFPRRDAARVPLFEAAIKTQSRTFALGILEPLFGTQFLRPDARQPEAEDEEIASEPDEQDHDEVSENVSSLADAQLTRAQQAHVAELVGDLMTQAGRLADAQSYYQTARVLEKSPPARKILTRKIDQTRDSLRILHENLARQPLLHEALEQDRVVRPRIVARTGVVTQSSAKGAAIQ